MWYSEDVEDFIGDVFSEEVLLGRGFVINKYKSEVLGILPEKGANKCASNFFKRSLSNSFNSGEIIWLKCFPGEFKYDNIETRPILVFTGLEDEEGYEVEGFSVFSLNLFHINTPIGPQVKTSVERMDYIPDEVYKEFFKLRQERFVPKDFNLVGKPMPKDKSKFYDNPKYSVSCNSGWRSAYWHMQINVDSNDIIQGVEYRTYENQNSMFSRPKSIEEDPGEYIDCINYICDQYNDDEWNSIIEK